MFSQRIFILVLGDIAAFLLSFFIMTRIRFEGFAEQAISEQFMPFFWLFLIWLITFFIFDLYEIKKINPSPTNIGLLSIGITTNIVVGVLFFYLLPQTKIAPKTNLLIVGVLSFILTILWRRLYYHLFAKQFRKSILLIGDTQLIYKLKSEIENHPQIGFICLHIKSLSEPINIKRVNTIIAENIETKLLIKISQKLNAEILPLHKAYEIMFSKINLSTMNEDKALFYISKERNIGVHIIYRIIEILVASLVLIISSPILLLAMFARFIEDGSPIFYSQERVGKNGKIFRVYKIRSMLKDAEKSGATWATQKDKRITPLGSILRKTHIDEIPQMINIIKGDIALVGPRPERPEFVRELEQQIPYYYLRHYVRPGFTGWAQVKYRYARTVDDSKEKFEFDLYYIKNKNPLLDIGIVLKTIHIIFTH